MRSARRHSPGPRLQQVGVRVAINTRCNACCMRHPTPPHPAAPTTACSQGRPHCHHPQLDLLPVLRDGRAVGLRGGVRAVLGLCQPGARRTHGTPDPQACAQFSVVPGLFQPSVSVDQRERAGVPLLPEHILGRGEGHRPPPAGPPPPAQRAVAQASSRSLPPCVSPTSPSRDPILPLPRSPPSTRPSSSTPCSAWAPTWR